MVMMRRYIDFLNNSWDIFFIDLESALILIRKSMLKQIH